MHMCVGVPDILDAGHQTYARGHAHSALVRTIVDEPAIKNVTYKNVDKYRPKK